MFRKVDSIQDELKVSCEALDAASFDVVSVVHSSLLLGRGIPRWWLRRWPFYDKKEDLDPKGPSFSFFSIQPSGDQTSPLSAAILNAETEIKN